MVTSFRQYWNSLFFSRRFYLAFVGLILFFLLAYLLPGLFIVAKAAVLLFIVIVIADYLLLHSRKKLIIVDRLMDERFSNGDTNHIELLIENRSRYVLSLDLIDELPVQFQLRDFSLQCQVQPFEKKKLQYSLRPVERGEYIFHDINCYARSVIGLIVRRMVIASETVIKVYPAYQALRKYELLAISNNLTDTGNRKIRKIGRSLEFEQIKEYVRGDDIRNINWKATARRAGQLMVNSFMDERSQQVYCIIDKGRVMKMPFNGMTLHDHAINAALVLSHVAIVRQDRTGLITFSNDVGSFIPAERRAGQMNDILEALYREETQYLETDYEKIYALIRMRIPQRSLLVLFTNFESMSSLKRQLPYLRMISKKHLLLVVFFENPGLKDLTEGEADDIETVYIKTIARKFSYEKRRIVKELHQHGIIALLTAPEQLTIHTVNKYLELKSRQAI